MKHSEIQEITPIEDEETNEDSFFVNIEKLEGLEWLDDTIINSYGKMLQSQFPESIFVFDSHFLEKLQADGYDGV